jgi:hypothetical protein
MSKKSKREYVAAIRERYLNGTKSEKQTILDELCATCGYHRKHAIRLLGRSPRAPKARAGRPLRYRDPLVLSVLVALWRASNGICGTRLRAVIADWLPHYEQRFGVLPKSVRAQLLTISAATINRHLVHVRKAAGRHGISTTKPGSLLKTHIPIQTGQWEEKRVGYLEADTVAHCGGSMAGNFVYTLDCVDIASGWTAQRAVWGKGEHNVFQALKDIERTLPFKLRGFDCDNGGELLNNTMLHYFTHHHPPVYYTRSREYKSNDNAHIEGKNWTHVRQLLGYNRFENRDMVDMMNELYTTEVSLLANFFLPSVKLIKKDRIGSRIVRRHDKPQTPAQRLLASPDVTQQTKKWIRRTLKENNPFDLRDAIDAKRNAILKLATPYKTVP